MSPRQLERLFEKSAGSTVSQMIAQERIKQAKRLLEAESGMSIAQVAEQLHFPNEYNFIRFFKRVEGVTPGKYRARTQKIT